MVVLEFVLSAALIAGCTARAGPGSISELPAEKGATRSIAELTVSSRCAAFLSTFEELVACERADGTLDSFSDPNITWRVRYYVRYWEMPCGEEPTVQEAYVFHMVTGDLYNDVDLDDVERLAIRNRMSDGQAHCK